MRTKTNILGVSKLKQRRSSKVVVPEIDRSNGSIVSSYSSSIHKEESCIDTTYSKTSEKVRY